MCGIAGLLSGDRLGMIDEDRLHDVAALLRHRGPDAQNVWREPGISIAHTRLAIIDRAGGDQPMFTDDGRYVVVFNGEIYNHHELARELREAGRPLRTHCDTEVLPSLFAHHGERMVERLRGMFAFAILDRRDGSAFLARDRVGKKPLYLAERNGSLLFASTVDALVRLGDIPLDLDAQAIYEYLVLQYVPSPLAPIRGVRKLPPAHVAVWREGRLAIRPYWRPPARSRRRGDPPRPADLERLREGIGEAVRIRLESEVPLGIFLSGGLDSSVVVAEAARAGIAPGTFSVGFVSESHDETRYAHLVAKRFGTQHTRLVADDEVTGLFELFTSFYDEPFADSSALASLAVARAAADHVTVVLTGDGGDELFGGYPRYHRYRRWLRARRAFGPMATVAGSAAVRLGSATRRPRVTSLGRMVGDPWSWYRHSLFHFQPEDAQRLLRPEARAIIDPSAPIDRLDALWRQGQGRAVDLLAVDTATYLPDDLLTKMDRATMAFGVEARSPLLDHELASLCASYPDRWLLGDRLGKGVVRRAYRGILPAEVLTRPKQGFGVPIGDWMRGELLAATRRLLLSRDAPLWTFLNPEVGTAVVRRFLGGEDRLRNQAWNLLALAGWLDRRIEPGEPVRSAVSGRLPETATGKSWRRISS